ncbi:MAG: hypothetical protein JJE19_06955 [Methanosarcinales archaeon]|nr:hypothetical protein [Methanosarcinales archaeon]
MKIHCSILGCCEEDKCRLLDPQLIVAPRDKGEPPLWVPAWHGEDVVRVDRDLFEKLKKLRHEYDKPCNICPDEIKSKCEVETLKKYEEKEEKSHD